MQGCFQAHQKPACKTGHDAPDKLVVIAVPKAKPGKKGVKKIKGAALGRGKVLPVKYNITWDADAALKDSNTFRSKHYHRVRRMLESDFGSASNADWLATLTHFSAKASALYFRKCS